MSSIIYKALTIFNAFTNIDFPSFSMLISNCQDLSNPDK
ncbi:hypothetical protein RCH33_432 [Flavobacterium daejeonense]|nr:hypothetical protein RCH33_432 [Flavobacterium daejeonense]